MNERGKYEWHCCFNLYGDKLDLHLTEHNGCRTYKQLQRWWRLHYPQYKLKNAVKNENK